MSLSQEVIVRTLLGARTRISASAWMVTRDVQATEAIFQNLSVKALAGEPLLERKARLFPWPHTPARHEALNWIRSRKGRIVSLDDAVLHLVAEEWEEPAEGPRLNALRGCLETLHRGSRQILAIRYWEQRPCPESARTVGLG